MPCSIDMKRISTHSSFKDVCGYCSKAFYSRKKTGAATENTYQNDSLTHKTLKILIFIIYCHCGNFECTPLGTA